jgi:GAF domain-containing protein
MLTKDDIEALSAGAGQSPDALFRAVEQVAARRVGAGLVTVMRHHAAEREVERLYSSNRDAYPVGGRKQKRDTGWSRKVLAEHRVLLSAGDDGIRDSFEDHAIIFGLGLHSCVNVPLVSEGQCVGTLNVLRARPDWNDDEVAIARALGLAALAGVLMMRAS